MRRALPLTPPVHSPFDSGGSNVALRPRLAESLQLVEEREGDGRAFDTSGSGEIVERHGATLRLLKSGSGAFYAPNPIRCIAMHLPRLVAGTRSGELYHLEVQE